jgi:hypothetical protein
LENALIWYKKRIEYGGWFEEVYISFLEKGIIMIQLGLPAEEIISTFMDGFRVIPNRAECLFYIAQYYFENKRIIEAYNTITLAYKIPFPHQYMLFMKKDLYDYRIKQLRYFIMIFMYLNNIESSNITKKKIFNEIAIQKKLMFADPLVPELVKQYLNFKLELKINDKIYSDYTFYKSLDSVGNDIGFFPNIPIDELKKVCDSMENAIGFNTYGYIKSKILNTNELTFLENKNYNYDGLYIKNIKL